MTPRRVVAPGKLVLLGEYAVLDGVDAIVAAVDRGVVVDVTDGAGIVTPTGDDRFVRAAIGDRPGRYVFSDQHPVDLPEKPGFGGSAAATVAACLACGRPGADAFAVHAAVQGGGSGIDVFASLHGGVRWFPSGEPVDCPPFVAVWSGRSAATGPRVRRFLASPARAAFVADLREIVAGFPERPFQTVRLAYARTCAMAAEAGLDYDLPVFHHLDALAAAHGGAAKPSGAGGGDIAVAFLPDLAARAAFEAACRASGLTPLPVSVAPAAG